MTDWEDDDWPEVPTRCECGTDTGWFYRDGQRYWCMPCLAEEMERLWAFERKHKGSPEDPRITRLQAEVERLSSELSRLRRLIDKDPVTGQWRIKA